MGNFVKKLAKTTLEPSHELKMGQKDISDEEGLSREHSVAAGRGCPESVRKKGFYSACVRSSGLHAHMPVSGRLRRLGPSQ